MHDLTSCPRASSAQSSTYRPTSDTPPPGTHMPVGPGEVDSPGADIVELGSGRSDIFQQRCPVAGARKSPDVRAAHYQETHSGSRVLAGEIEQLVHRDLVLSDGIVRQEEQGGKSHAEPVEQISGPLPTPDLQIAQRRARGRPVV